jgi:hypothetical protein
MSRLTRAPIVKAAAMIPLARRGFGEVLLIFLGITLALMFENWNSDRERKLQELNLLAELYLDLEETRIDLERDIVSTERGLENGRLMIEAFNGEPVGAEEFGQAYASGIIRGRLFAKTSAYESIKTIGLDLIENNELRKLVADVHELFLSRILTDQDEVDSDIQLYRDYGRALFVFPQKVEFTRDAALQALDTDLEVAVSDSIRPANYAVVLSDQGFRILLVRLFNQAAEIRGRYLALQDAILEVEQQIRAELALHGRGL